MPPWPSRTRTSQHPEGWKRPKCPESKTFNFIKLLNNENSVDLPFYTDARTKMDPINRYNHGGAIFPLDHLNVPGSQEETFENLRSPGQLAELINKISINKYNQ